MADCQQNGIVLLTVFRVTADAVPVLTVYRDSGTASSHLCWPARQLARALGSQPRRGERQRVRRDLR